MPRRSTGTRHWKGAGRCLQSSRFNPLHVFLILVAGLGTNPVLGQDKPASPPSSRYPIPRYEESWSFLRDSSKRDDFWDPLKFIPLSQDGTVFLSLGAESRLTY